MGRSLGQDLEIEILVRLPAKSLMRFKCVQRSWNVLFKTPYFVKRHMQMINTQSNDHPFIIFPSIIEEGKNKVINILSLHDNPTLTPIGNNFSKKPFKICLHGHCNGVFCIQQYLHKDLLLWNPTTQEVHVLPQPSIDRIKVEKAEAFIGFGVDPNTNEFKVVKVSIHHHKGLCISFSLAQVYNHSTKSWTLIPCPILPSETIPYLGQKHLNKYNTLVHGVYHWLIGPNHDEHDFNILCFDFHNNQFQLLESPVQYNRFDDYIAEINGSLAYVKQIFYPIHEMRIWVKDQQGWIKKYNINVTLDRGVDHILRVLSKGKDDVQVFGRKWVEKLMMLYDKDGNLLYQFQLNLPCEMWIHEYVQSIAPLST